MGKYPIDLVNARLVAHMPFHHCQISSDTPPNSTSAIMQFRIACMYSYCRKIIILMVIAFTIEVISMTAINLAYLDVVVGELLFQILNSRYLFIPPLFFFTLQKFPIANSYAWESIFQTCTPYTSG
jgi:hypothetical protein